MRRELRNETKTSEVKSITIESFDNFTIATEACQICDSIGHTAKKCPQIIQSDIHREVVYSEKVTPLLDKIRESDFDTGYESFTSESGDLIGNLEMQIEQVIDRFTEAAAETQNTSLQEKDSVIEVPKTSIQENHVVDAPKTRRGRPRRHRVKFKERRLSPHEVTPLLDPDTNSEPDSAVGEDTSSESVDSINDLLQHKDNTIQFPKDNTVQVLNSNRQPDDEGLRIQKLSDTRLNSRFTDTRQVYWTQKTNTNNFDLEIHKWKARSKLKKPTVKLKGLFKRALQPKRGEDRLDIQRPDGIRIDPSEVMPSLGPDVNPELTRHPMTNRVPVNWTIGSTEASKTFSIIIRRIKKSVPRHDFYGSRKRNFNSGTGPMYLSVQIVDPLINDPPTIIDG
ncbi:hypothetical protein KQX54_016124 [Cotesia glomerata]|uniref:CCHC-type domain-containing protein n=1 Tax=Cotesia glomerata TaxID=32391 RepID=A0AAV7ISW6_COTGL|nr:hypothetical protein KQX54_016124 [Cotesia glomerata]